MASANEDREKAVIGYPQPEAFPGPAPPYPGYRPPPPAGYPNPPYQYAEPPPAFYYTTSQYYLPTNPKKSSGYTFARVMLFMMIALIVSMCLMSIISWIIFGSDIPQFHIRSFSVPALNVTNSTLYATWDANFTVRNPSQRLEVHFSHINSILSYNDYPLDTFMIEPFHLGKNDEGTFHAKFVSPSGSIDTTTDSLWVKEMAEQRSKGSVFYDLRLKLVVTFNSGSVWRKHLGLKVVCENLEVHFSDATGGGTLTGDEHECYLLA